MQEMNTETLFLNAEQLAIRWQVDRGWIYRNHELVGIPTQRFGSTLRFPIREIEKWEATHCINSINPTKEK